MGPGELWTPSSVTPLPPSMETPEEDAPVHADLLGPPWNASPWGHALAPSAAEARYAVAAGDTVKVFTAGGDEVMRIGMSGMDPHIRDVPALPYDWDRSFEASEPRYPPFWSDSPSCVAYDADSQCLFVAAPPDDGVKKIDKFGNLVERESWGYAESSLCVANGLLYVSYEAETGNGGCACSVVLAADMSQTLLKRVPRWHMFDQLGPSDMAADATMLVACQPERHSVGLWRVEKSAGSVKVRLERLLGKKVAVADRVNQFTIRAGDAPGEFQEPCGVALSDELLLVAERAGKRVQVLTKKGEPLQVLSLGGYRGGPICADAFRVVVCDGAQGRDVPPPVVEKHAPTDRLIYLEFRP